MSIPYLPLYVADFEADTRHLTTEEDGAFNRLMRLQWKTPGCTMPDDNEWIRRRCIVDEAEFDRAYLPVIDEFFKRSRGRVFSSRLLSEYTRINDTSSKRSSAGKKGVRKRKSLKNIETELSPAKANEQAGNKHLEPELEPDKPPIPPEGEKGGEVELFPEHSSAPIGYDPDLQIRDKVGADFRRHRTRVKAPLTDGAFTFLNRELLYIRDNMGIDPNDALIQVMGMGWKGLKREYFAGHSSTSGGRTGNGSSQPIDRLQEARETAARYQQEGHTV